ncbi:MAG: PEP-CTERM sorting domain-containing protein [Akkermansiaceae bacterium]|nr:PEP-CTERM sorting domain-containing protein [Akkermansiaceae bacterium]
MMKTSLALVILSSVTSAATVSIGGGAFANLLDASGNNLPTGSQVQLGYFLGVAPSKSGDDFTSVDWDSFSPFLGVGSSNPDEVIGTFDAGGGFESAFQISSTLDTDLGDSLPLGFPVRLGFRIFDSTQSLIEGASYNTVVRDVSTWVFNDPGIVTNQPPTPSISSTNDPLMFWEDSANPFQTSIGVPEPSSVLSALLGATLFLGHRKRA